MAWGRLGASWGRLGASWERLGRGLGRLGAVLERLERRLGSVLGGFRGLFGRPGASWHLFGASAAPFSYQIEALRLGCHLVLDFYSFLHGFLFGSQT